MESVKTLSGVTERKPRSFGTHDGTFHADEVCACALLVVFDLIDTKAVIRTRDLTLLEKCQYVCDVGGVYDPKSLRFDHHQQQYTGEKSSAGLVLSYLRDTGVINKSLYQLLQDALIMGVDAHDIGRYTPERGVCTFSQVISNFAPFDYEASEKEWNESFYAALHFTIGHLKRLLERHYNQIAAREEVKRVMQNSSDLLVFEKSLPWLENFFSLGGKEHKARFVIMPSSGNWKLRGIPPSLSERMQVRLPLPHSWGGLMDGELEKASGLQGAVFCHKGLFISVWKTKEAALLAYQKAIEMYDVEKRSAL